LVSWVPYSNPSRTLHQRGRRELCKSLNCLWEAWVETLLVEVALRLGARLEVGRRRETVRPLIWKDTVRSLSHLVPDFIVRLPGRAVCVDAKYKRHLELLCARRWEGLSEAVREAHRADVHQALACAGAAPERVVDTVLVYPVAGVGRGAAGSVSVAELSAGERRVRLLLVGLPFGFHGAGDREATLGLLEQPLRAA
jgi:hypothetical protein